MPPASRVLAPDANDMQPTALSYVGTRPYIRGADLYAWFERQVASALRGPAEPATLIAFKLLREVARDGLWRDHPQADAAASVDVKDAGGAVRRYAFVESGKPIVRRSPDIPSAVRRLDRRGEFAGTAIVAEPKGVVDFMNGLIEANKSFHVQTLSATGAPADRIRLIYIENLPLTGWDGADVALEFRFLGARRAPGRTYTLCAVAIDGRSDALRICYSY